MNMMIPAGIGLFLVLMMVFITVFLAFFIIALLLARGTRSRGRPRSDFRWSASDVFDASRNPETNTSDQHHNTDSSAHQPHHCHQHPPHHHHTPLMPDTHSHHQMPSMPDMSSHHPSGGFDAGAHPGGSHHSH